MIDLNDRASVREELTFLLNALPRDRAIVTLVSALARFGFDEKRAVFRTLAAHLISESTHLLPPRSTPSSVKAALTDTTALLHQDVDDALRPKAVGHSGSAAGLVADEGSAS